MHKQTYHIGTLLTDANVKNLKVPLQVNCCGFSASKGHNELKRIRKDYYLMYVLSGEIEYYDDVISEGDIIIFESEHEINYMKKGNFSYLWLHFTGFEARSLAEKAFGCLNKKIYIGMREDIENLFEKLFQEFIIKDEHFETMTVSILRQILSLSARYRNETDLPLKSITYLHSHYDENIQIETLSDMENMCLTAYRKVFKKHMGVSPNEYLIDLRISTACRLLSQSNEKISDIASKVGYDDQYYFSRIFTKKIGKSPREYRKNAI